MLLLACLIGTALGAECNGESTPGPPNNLPIDTAAPVFVASTANGKHYTVGSGDDQVDVVHVYGSPYDWGFAHGTLMKSKLVNFFPEVQKYMETQVIAKAQNNTFLAWVAKVGLDAALDLSYDVTKKYTPDYAIPEIQGIADAAGTRAPVGLSPVRFSAVPNEGGGIKCCRTVKTVSSVQRVSSTATKGCSPNRTVADDSLPLSVVLGVGPPIGSWACGMAAAT